MTSKIALAALAAVSFAGAASAQKAPAAAIVTVDIQRVQTECAACKTAGAALQAQVTSLQQRGQQLQTSLQTEATSLRTALNGKDPATADAATKARITAFEQKQQSAQQEMAGREQTVQRNRAYVSQQISNKLGPIFTAVMTAHGANLVVDEGNTLAAAPALDVTNDVLTQLNAQLPTVSATAPAQAAPQGR